MAEPINVTDLTQVGRSQVPDRNPEPVSYNYNADFTAANAIVFNFATINQQRLFGVPKTVFIDNGTNPNPVMVAVTITNQGFSVPAYAQGRFSLDATQNSEITFTTDGGATDKTKIVLYNYEIAPVVWYSYGTFNNAKTIKVEGSMGEGSIVATETDNKPVYIGGIDRTTGEFVGIKVDDQGRLDFSSTITIGAIYGPDAVGIAPTHPPVLDGVLDSAGNVANVQLNANAEFKTHDADLLAETKGPSGSAITSVAAAVVSTQLLAANAARKGAVFYNNSSSAVNIALANVNAVVSFSLILPANSSFTLQHGDYTGRVNAAWATATGSMLVTELT